MNNAWTCEKLAYIHVKMPHGANTIKKRQNGTNPNQQNWKFLQKLSFSNPNIKINPTLSFKKSKTKSKDMKEEKG